MADLIGADLVDEAAYETHRVMNGVPRGGLDFMYSDAFPHETNMDRLGGVERVAGFDGDGFHRDVLRRGPGCCLRLRL